MPTSLRRWAAAHEAAAYATGRLASSWLFDVRASDPIILASGLAVVLGITCIATVMSARRATRIDPAIVLQSGSLRPRRL